jgi:Ala-tRNA(Pro) deacylase
MLVTKLREFLDKNQVKYVSLRHSEAFTAQQTAASARVPGRELAKTVMLLLDDEMVMAVLPATQHVDVDRLRKAAGAARAELASELEFKGLFPSCEPGAMPPFGNLYGIPVYVDNSLREDAEIAFNAGSHTELIRLAYADFERLVHPKLAAFGRV